MMNPEIKEKWCQALESGAFIQGTGYLCVASNSGTAKYCCLGVLCEISGIKRTVENTFPRMVNSDFSYKYIFDKFNYSMSFLPDVFMDKMNIDELDAKRLIELNDSGKSFIEIAKYIRENM